MSRWARGQRRPRSGALLALAFLVGCGRVGFAAQDGADAAPVVVRTFARTGTDGAGTFLAFNAPDPDYRLVAAADGATEALTTDGTGRWYSTPPASARWITSANNANGTAARTASGDYTFEVDIDTTGVILTAPGLVLVVAAMGDDTMAIDINGTEVDAASAPTILWEPDRFTFAASSLTDGLNTVRFRVNNGLFTTGLFVDELALEQQ